MKTIALLTARNIKIFFKDKGLFFAALIAPLVLLFLFVVFLGDVYRDSMISVLSAEPKKAIVEGFAGGWLVSSLLAVCTVSIAFTANIVMVQDKVTGVKNDFIASPVPASFLAIAYFAATAAVTAIVCYAALLAGLLYIACVGWYLSVADVFLTLLDVFLMVLFATALSSVVNYFLHSQGGITVVEVVVSAAYGFLCGAYMPISSLAKGLQYVLLFLPGTYGTSLLHSHLMNGAIEAACTDLQLPAVAEGELKKGFDCDLYFFEGQVPEWAKYLVVLLTTAVLVGAYVLLCSLKRKKPRQKGDLL